MKCVFGSRAACRWCRRRSADTALPLDSTSTTKLVSSAPGRAGREQAVHVAVLAVERAGERDRRNRLAGVEVHQVVSGEAGVRLALKAEHVEQR